ncbi:reverse transcriptase domain-containing protein [Tanacetum coccineum]
MGRSFVSPVERSACNRSAFVAHMQLGLYGQKQQYRTPGINISGKKPRINDDDDVLGVLSLELSALRNWGKVLGQRKNKHFQPKHYASKTMNEAQTHYTTTEKELLAVVYAFEKFRSYLVMSKSIVYTDHSAIKYLFAKKMLRQDSCVAKPYRLMQLVEYMFENAKMKCEYKPRIDDDDDDDVLGVLSSELRKAWHRKHD